MLTWYKMRIVQLPIIGIGRRRPVRARQLRVICRQAVHRAVRRRQRVRCVFKTRKNPGPHQEGDVGKVTNPRREVVVTSDSGQVNVRKDKDPPRLDPRHQVKVAPTCAATVGKTVGGRSGRPTFASTGSTQRRELEAGLEIAYWRRKSIPSSAAAECTRTEARVANWLFCLWRDWLP